MLECYATKRGNVDHFETYLNRLLCIVYRSTSICAYIDTLCKG